MPIPADAPECLNEEASVDRQDFPKMVGKHGGTRYIQGSCTMLDKSYSQTSHKPIL